ncbi:uncharacterized protein SPSK_00190 [Sporothrix schenckii 1099-18]|uniref:Uncharacterized protein n=2 Tax=Sporothrix schenckii TaxID=29908 RepID=U7PLN9_SPOS1|nr:uncharacterized protein SPSK_00190 [Sporothrix schenckii 1099-18]ERS95659.1 hypothetical protein HMPREF1624_07733 [Sporothrix schenckii ATCC 58251]KJR83674.1 hypothetical protein SPSK_00190 [Sporothrix schenckii 1099-18]
MATFSNAVADLMRSVYEALAATFLAVIHFFESGLTFAADTVRHTVALVGGIGKFVAGNFVILAIIAAVYLYFVSNPQQKNKIQSSGQKTTSSVQSNANRGATKSKRA